MARGEELRQAWRALGRGRGFALAALLLIGLGVGATTAVFSAVNGIVLRPLALPQPGQLVLVGERIPQMPQLAGLAWYDTASAFLAWQREATDFRGLAALYSSRLPVEAGGETRLLHGVKVTPNFFAVLETPMALGRGFVPHDAEATSDPVILTDALWRSAYHADPDIVGRNIAPAGAAATVVGVLPAGFRLEGRELGPMFAGQPAEFFRPFDFGSEEEQQLPVLSDFSYHVIGRLRAGVTRAQALAQLNVIQAELARTAPERVSLFATLTGVREFAVAEARQELWLLFGGAAAVLLIICVNLGGLWLGRMADRRREWAIRAALGAAPGQLVRQVMGEGLMLGAGGGILGLSCAGLSLRALIAAAPASVPRLHDVRVDGRVLAFGLGLSVLAGLLTGLVPALRLRRLDPQEALRLASAAVTPDAASVRSRQVLLGLQAALSTLLLTLAGLLGLSFYRLIAQPTGFVAPHAAEAEISMIGYGTEPRLAILQQLPGAALSLPGVTQAGFSTSLPLTGERGSTPARVPGKTYSAAGPPSLYLCDISPGYLDALGVPRLAGRDLRESDRSATPLVISTAGARLLWPEVHDPHALIGLELEANGLRWHVVGVAGDVRASLTAPAPPMAYVPYWVSDHWVPYSGSLVVRTTLTSAALAPALRQAVRQLAPGAPLSPLKSLDQLEADAVASQRYQLRLLWVFALLALGLAALGMYALAAHSVARRGKELAIRISLGASAGGIARAVVPQALTPVLAGLAGGLGVALLGRGVLAAMLFQVNPSNPAVLAAAAGSVLLAAAGACLGPARRAVRTDPLAALRAE